MGIIKCPAKLAGNTRTASLLNFNPLGASNSNVTKLHTVRVEILLS
jgi:hypothetical protein